mmetsp:Transcript_7764/g.17042  ORF Transcript_7764/g.17042 Transcript_7764/m.17042 type:complete len:89 (+) Transcript_7764:96-362(+)
MKLPVTVWERLQYTGKYRLAMCGVATLVVSKVIWDSGSYIYKNWGQFLTLDTRRKRFDPVRIEQNRERREQQLLQHQQPPQQAPQASQ